MKKEKQVNIGSGAPTKKPFEFTTGGKTYSFDSAEGLATFHENLEARKKVAKKRKKKKKGKK